MRHCKRCGLDRPEEMWYPDFVWCKPCRKEYDRGYHSKNKDKRVRQAGTRRSETRAWIASLKEGPCSDCGNVYPPQIMQFDHLPGENKEYTIAQSHTLSRERIMKEIEKCELVCPTCHALRTLKRRSVG